MIRKYGFLLAVAALVTTALFLDFVVIENRASLRGYALGINLAKREAASGLKRVYDLSFGLDETPIGAVNTYVPVYQPVEPEHAAEQFVHFGLLGAPDEMINNMGETADFYSVNDSEGKFCVYKFQNRIRYIINPANQQQPGATQIYSDREALNCAETFVTGLGLLLNYEEVEVTSDEGLYDVSFINRIGNIQNRAFTTRVCVLSDGRVQEMDYNYMNYDKLGSVKIKSMADAFLELPQDYPDDIAISLDRCELVYVLADSVVQPAYMFAGQYPGGKSFKSFIPAAIFE